MKEQLKTRDHKRLSHRSVLRLARGLDLHRGSDLLLVSLRYAQLIVSVFPIIKTPPLLQFSHPLRSGEETVRRKAEVGKEKANASEGIKWPFLFLKQLLHLLTFSSKNCSAGGF